VLRAAAGSLPQKHHPGVRAAARDESQEETQQCSESKERSPTVEEKLEDYHNQAAHQKRNHDPILFGFVHIDRR